MDVKMEYKKETGNYPCLEEIDLYREHGRWILSPEAYDRLPKNGAYSVLIPDLDYISYLEDKVEKLSANNNNLSVNYLVDVLKRTLQGDERVRVKFDNEADEIDYILDVCNCFKRQLEKDKSKQ